MTLEERIADALESLPGMIENRRGTKTQYIRLDTACVARFTEALEAAIQQAYDDGLNEAEEWTKATDAFIDALRGSHDG